MARKHEASTLAVDAAKDTTHADFRRADALSWREALITGDVSAVELSTMALTSAAAHMSLGAFIHLDPDASLARAEEIDAVRSLSLGSLPPRAGSTTEGRDGPDPAALAFARRNPLAGLPIAFKDLLDVAGMPTTRGSEAVPHRVAHHDDPGVRRVHHAGGVSVGKTQVPEFGLPCYSENTISAPARNPLDPARTSGGSTGGGATAVAAGILPFAPGNDGGGSVRIPAAACGLVGLKPGRGRLPTDQQGSSVRNLGVSGPIARTAHDAALLFDVMAGHAFSVERGADGLSEGPAMRTVRTALQRAAGDGPPLSIAVDTRSPFSPDVDITLEEPAVEALEKGIAAARDAGHRVSGAEGGPVKGGGTGRGTPRGPAGAAHAPGSEIWPPDYHRSFRTLWTSALANAPLSPDQESRVAPLTRHFIELSRARSAEETGAAIAHLQAYADVPERCLGGADVLMTPMLAFAPPEIGWFSSMEPEENYLQQCRFTPYSSVVNVLGLPAINVPMHADDRGLSWSVQLIGGRGTEESLLALAATLMRD